MKHLFKVVFGLILAALPARAADKDLVQVPIADSPSYSKVALVIGVNDYQFANKLNMCVDDAAAVNQFLQTKMNFPPEAVTMMTDAAGTDRRLEPTYTKLRHSIDTFINSVDEKSEVVFFFSGHGVRFGDEDFLVPQDGSANDIVATCISYNILKSRLESKNPRRVLLIVDACRSLLDGKGEQSSGFGDSAAPREPQFAELRSCRPAEKSMEGKAKDFQAGVFTHFLLKGLSGDPEAVAKGTDLVTFDSLRYYVRGKVNQYVTTNFVGNVQNPIGYSTLGAMVLAKAGTTTSEKEPIIPVAPQRDGEQNGKTKINPIDRAEMVWVPAGEFIMGSSESQIDSNFELALQYVKDVQREYPANQGPQRRVYLDGYWIYKHEVTVAQYRRFCNATGRAMPDTPYWGWKEDHPVVNILWEEGLAYCDWAGVSLPTEAQWEKAARGTDGRLYVWGNAWPPPQRVGNFSDEAQRHKNPGLPWTLSEYDDGYTETSPVGSFPAGASPYGALDMAGNAWEWCSDWLAPYEASETHNPIGQLTGQYRVMRGGSFGDQPVGLRLATRIGILPDHTRNDLIGFRCAQNPR